MLEADEKKKQQGAESLPGNLRNMPWAMLSRVKAPTARTQPPTMGPACLEGSADSNMYLHH
eukprot:8495184-Prorocentrum_lima.AAC.1